MRRMLIWSSFNLGFLVARIMAFDAATSPANAPNLADHMGFQNAQPNMAEPEPYTPVSYSSLPTGT